MKLKLITGLFLLTAWTVFPQRLATIAVFPFEAAETGPSPSDAAGITGQVLAELRSWGTMTVVEEDRAETAEYLVRGQLSRAEGGLVLSATTYDAKTGKALNTAREQGAALPELSGKIFSFCAQVVESVPFPNYLLGKWRSTLDLGDGILTCVLEFRTDRTVVVEQYETYERRGDSALKYQGYGRGTYSYGGHVRRLTAFKDARGVVYREAPVDGSMSINVSLEDALPKYGAINQNRISLAFDDEKNNFELLSAGLLCGDTPGSPPVAYSRFTKIQ
jgi:TolB-like protein